MKNSSTNRINQRPPQNIHSGIIFAFKKVGITSQQLASFYKRKYNFKKIGHAGTLDPFATGLVILLVNKATSLQDYFMSMKKIYKGTIQLGQKTDTLDLTGEVIATKKLQSFTKEQCLKIIEEKFSGEIEQTPPHYSAIKINGKRAYSLARNNVDFEIKSRKVKIHSFTIQKIAAEKIYFTVECSKGTYIRSLASDFAECLDNVGHLQSLERTHIGDFTYQKNSLTEEEILKNGIEKKSFQEKKNIDEKEIIPVDKVIKGEKINLMPNQFQDLLHGKFNLSLSYGYNKLYYDNKLFQIFFRDKKNIKKFFHENLD